MTSAHTQEVDTKNLVKRAKRESAQPAAFTFWDLTDDGLLRVRRDYLRLIEDNAGRPHAKIDAWLASIRWVRLVRWALHMRYGAVDEHAGTRSWDRYNRFDEAPTYSLALEIDKLRWSYRDHLPTRGTRRHILDWDRLGDGEPHWIRALETHDA